MDLNQKHFLENIVFTKQQTAPKLQAINKKKNSFNKKDETQKLFKSKQCSKFVLTTPIIRRNANCQQYQTKSN
jgi:hypothetical protein